MKKTMFLFFTLMLSIMVLNSCKKENLNPSVNNQSYHLYRINNPQLAIYNDRCSYVFSADDDFSAGKFPKAAATNPDFTFDLRNGQDKIIYNNDQISYKFSKTYIAGEKQKITLNFLSSDTIHQTEMKPFPLTLLNGEYTIEYMGIAFRSGINDGAKNYVLTRRVNNKDDMEIVLIVR